MAQTERDMGEGGHGRMTGKEKEKTNSSQGEEE